MISKLSILVLLALCFSACREEEEEKTFQLIEAFVRTIELDISGNITEGIPPDPTIILVFSSAVDQASAGIAIQLKKDQLAVATALSFLADGRTVAVHPAGTLERGAIYTLELSGQLQNTEGVSLTPVVLSFKTVLADLALASAEINGTNFMLLAPVTDVPLNLSVTLGFSFPVSPASFEDAVTLQGPDVSGLNFSYSNDNKTVAITTSAPMVHLSRYQFTVSEALKGAQGEPFGGFSKTMYTVVDPTPKMPMLTDDELLTTVQQQTFKYFWDFVHPASGMARERNTSGDIVTSGGSGFGIMALIVGIERGFISRAEGLERMDKILTFLEAADRFRGAWPHWINGNTGDVVPFSANDNGGDLVETSFLMQGLLTFRQYLDGNLANEKSLIDRINALWETVEWDWYTKGENVLYWHWSPDKAWIMNHPVHGYNEALITYFLGAASPAHPITAAVYHEGWAANGDIVNNGTFFEIALPVGYDYGGPLFFAHYSFLGLDPRNLADTYADYWTQNVNHTLINHAHAVANPKNYVGYSDENWGFTASDNHQGYSAHSPTNDLGVITPTAALSSIPYAPEQSMKALKFFYYTLGDRLWGPYGFYDAFNITEAWTADSYLAIDQGPIIIMIENYRSGLLWDLFTSSPEVQVAMDELGFTR